MDWPLRNLLSSSSDDSTSTSHSTSDYSVLDAILTWEVAVLFVGFVVITVIWEFSIAIMSFLTVALSGRKALWIHRLKDEILALGVITLVLTLFQDKLAAICIPGSVSFHVAATEHQCPDGQRLLFTAHMIHETHLLLFCVAVVFIFYTCISLYLSLFRMRWWRPWERAAKDGKQLDLAPQTLFADLTHSPWLHALRMTFIAPFITRLQQPLYTNLRLLFRLRMDATATEKLPRQLNFINVVEQAMEVEFTEAAEHSWVLLGVMAIFLAIPRSAYPLYWLCALSLLATLVVAAKLQSMVVQLGAISFFDFGEEIALYQHQQTKGFRSTGLIAASVKSRRMNRQVSVELSRATGRADLYIARSAAELHSPSTPTMQHGHSTHSMASQSLGLGSPAGAGPPRSQSPGPQGLPGGDRPGGEPASPAAGAAAADAQQQENVLLSAEPIKAAKANQVAPVMTDPSAPPSQYDGYRHRLKAHVVDAQTGDVALNLRGLYWWSSPRLLLWVFQLIYIENSLSLTLIFFCFARDGRSFIESEGAGPLFTLLVVDILLMVYCAVSVLPVYALVQTVAADEPDHLLHELKKQKLVEQEDHEQGVGGLLLRCCHISSGEGHGGGHGPGHGKDEESKAFIALLADQAGVIAAHSCPSHSAPTASRGVHAKVQNLYRQFAQVWRQAMQAWKAGQEVVLPSWGVTGELATFRKAFDVIDRNKSGTISVRELAGVLKAMGTRATIEELEDMVSEIDKDGSMSIDFKEFMLFMIFKFFDVDNDGYVTSGDVASGMSRLGIAQESTAQSMAEGQDLVDFVERDMEDRRGRIELSEFVHVFKGINLEESKAASLQAPPQLAIEGHGH